MRQLYSTDDPQFKRDGPNGAVLNTDQAALEQYRRQRAESLQVKQVIQDVAQLKGDITEIKELLRKLVAHV